MLLLKKEVSLYRALEIKGRGNGPCLHYEESDLKNRCQANKHTNKCKITTSPMCYKGKKDDEMK